MLPPSDSLLHHYIKLGEVTANMQNQKPLTSPPPPYTTNQQKNSVPEDIYPDNEIDTNIDEDTWDNSTPTPITINIDASISVQGNSNTIIIMTSGSPSAPTPLTTSSPTSTSMLQAAQKHRQNRITEMATSIIAALRESQDLSSSGIDGKGLIEININAGMKVEGSRNVISAGAGGGACRILPRAKRNGPSHNDDEDESSLKRKRRSQSVSSHFAFITLLCFICLT